MRPCLDIPLKILALDGNLLDQRLVTTLGELRLEWLELELISNIYRDERYVPNDRGGNRLVPLNWTDFNSATKTKVKLKMTPNFAESDKSLYETLTNNDCNNRWLLKTR